MCDFEIIDGVLKKYTGNSAKVIVPEGIEVIASGAFKYCNTVKEVELPATLEKTGISVFTDCESLEKVIMKSKFSIDVPSLVKPAPIFGLFCGCKQLKSAGPTGRGTDIEFAWDEYIPPMAFFGSELEFVTLPDSVLKVLPLSFIRNSRTHLDITVSPLCEIEKKAITKYTTIHFSQPINSKAKLGAGIVEYVNSDFINRLTNDELAWIILYQSKKWIAEVLNNIGTERAVPVLQSCYMILKDLKKVSSAQGKTLVELLAIIKTNYGYSEEAEKLKSFLEERKCTVSQLV